MTDYHYLPDEYDDGDDLPCDGAVQVAAHGVTIADDCTAKQAAAALWAAHTEDWCLEVAHWLRAEAALDQAARLGVEKV